MMAIVKCGQGTGMSLFGIYLAYEDYLMGKRVMVDYGVVGDKSMGMSASGVYAVVKDYLLPLEKKERDTGK